MSSIHSHNQPQFTGTFPPNGSMMQQHHQQQFPYPGQPPSTHGGYYDAMQVNQYPAEAASNAPVELPHNTREPPKVYPYIPPPQREDEEPRQ